MLNLQLANIDRLTDAKKSDIMHDIYTITEKYDGVKVSLIRTDADYNPENPEFNWIVAYKGYVIYFPEFEHAENIKNSMGASQFYLFHELLKEKREFLEFIPKNTELQIEFIMNKSTITRDYNIFHDMYLVDYSSIGQLKTSFGRVTTVRMTSPADPTGLTAKRYANILGIKLPRILIDNKVLMTQFSDYSNMKEELLSQESLLGGPIEGVVFESNDRMWKLLQSDQHDKTIRTTKKNRYRHEDKDAEIDYWNAVYTYAEQAVILVFNPNTNLVQLLDNLGDIVYTKGIPGLAVPTHTKKTLATILDDIQLTYNTILIKNLTGNNGVIIPGNFQPPTTAHIQIISDALIKYDFVVVNIVNNNHVDKKHPFMYHEICNMVNTCIGQGGLSIQDNTDRLFFQQTTTGNIITMINKAEVNINTVICGSDRYDGYNKQLTFKGFLNLVEIKRKENSISSSRLRSIVHDDEQGAISHLLPKVLWEQKDWIVKQIRIA